MQGSDISTLSQALKEELQSRIRRGHVFDVPAQQVEHSNKQPHSSLSHVRDKALACQACQLHEKRKTVVFGSGNENADLMFVGEGPGEQEDLTGEPFVGPAGELLSKIIGAIGMKRSDVYIANIVKCRPPNNRNPQQDEMNQCLPFLQQQIAHVNPKVICTLGAFAAQALLQTDTSISKLRGHFVVFGDAQLMPTFHPAYLLDNPSAKKQVWEDMKLVHAKLSELTGQDYKLS